MDIQCAAALSTEPGIDRALDEVVERAGLLGADLTVAFLSAAHGGEEAAERVSAALQSRLGPRVLLGCTVSGVIGGAREIEDGPALALWSASLPEGEIESFHLPALDEGVDPGTVELPDAGPGDLYMVLADPFGTPVLDLLAALPPGVDAMGALASGGSRPRSNRLLRDREVHDSGVVGARIRGVRVRAVVSQGCRPIGRPFLVTAVENNVVRALAGRPPLEQLQEVIEGLPAGDQRLARRGLHLGCAIDEYREEHGRGDFVIRNVIGVDPSSGAMAISDALRVGQTVQFHVRDGASARDDLQVLLGEAASEVDARGALLFSCNGRGSGLFGEPDVDPTSVRGALGDIPLAGCFAAGEIGPVGGENFLHGFTASVALFCA